MIGQYGPKHAGVCVLKHCRISNAICASAGHIVTMVPSTSKYTPEPTVIFDGRRVEAEAFVTTKIGQISEKQP